MCGRYYLEISKENMSFVSNIDTFEYKTNYNISPQSTVPAIINNELVNTTWGYFPGWLKEQDNPRPLFNSRYESLLEKKTFTSAFRNNRCLIPLSGWYEWRTENELRQPYFFYNKENLQIFTAGLFWRRSNGDIETLSLIHI